MTASMVKGAAAGNLIAESIKKALEWAKEWTVLRQAAWVLATYSDPSARNGGEAVKFAERAAGISIDAGVLERWRRLTPKPAVS